MLKFSGFFCLTSCHIEGCVCTGEAAQAYQGAIQKERASHCVRPCLCACVRRCLIVPHNARPILACRRDRERGRGRETRWTTSQLPQGAGYAPIQSLSLSRLPRSHLPHAQAAGVNKETDRQDSQTYRALTHSQPPQHVLQHTAPTVHNSDMQAGQSERLPHTHTTVLAAVGVKNANPELLF